MDVRKLVPQILINYFEHLPQALVANLIYGFPGRRIRVIGVTGTDGKTTTVNMIYSILKSAGKRVSMISTINAVVSGKVYNTGFHVTSPDPFLLQKLIQRSYQAGDEFLVLEVTSHALDQFRVWGVNFEIGVITNITHEHLDYHKTFVRYQKTKGRLIQGVKIAVLNHDDANFATLEKMSLGKVVSFGLGTDSDFNLVKFPLKLKIIGQYNLYNALAATAVCSTLGIDWTIIQRTLQSFETLKGRMEEIKNKRGIKVMVDFAHTPNALEAALKTLREITGGRLIAVFGAAALRDRSKRPKMGKVASDFADITILTNEDPRFEDENKIIEEIAGGISQSYQTQGKLFKMPDRARAIRWAVKMAHKGDTIGIFGKGHEESMSVLGVEKPWSDQKQAALALKYAR